MITQRLIQLYTACLRLYPSSFRTEFAGEMQEVFTQALLEARQESPAAVGRLCLSELAGLATSLVRAYAQAGRRDLADTGNPLEGSWRELTLALAVFLLPALASQANGGGGLDFPTAGLFMAVMLLIGWLGGFPLWSLPYVGVILAVAAYLQLFQWVAGLVRPALISNLSPGPWDLDTYRLLEVFSTGMMWLMLFCLTLLVVALLAVFNRFQPFLARLRQDWTLLSYTLYGESIFALMLLYKSHRFDPNYAIASLLFLLVGVWFYLRSPDRRQRLAALLACLTLAVASAALETGARPSTEGWVSGNALGSLAAGRLLFAWIWMVAALLLPGVLARLPNRRGQPFA